MRGRTTETLEIVEQAKELLAALGVMTLRHLYYLLISAGTIENSMRSYQALVRIISDARRRGEIDYGSLVDGTRNTVKPSSWSGLADFSDTVREAYRKDLWQEQEEYIELWCEKDAIVGVIDGITREYDVCIRPLRGYSSLTFIHHAAGQLNQIEKPITVYYLGDHDPSGYDIERSAKESLHSMLETEVRWTRLAITKFDIKDYDLIPLPAKPHDTRYKAFVREYGTEAVELDALPPDVLRMRVRQEIEDHINMPAWKKLQEIEELERERWNAVMSQLG